MSWLNLNQSLNSLKGQITSFATEVLSEGATEDSGDTSSKSASAETDLEEKCRAQELEIESLKKENEKLKNALQAAEKLHKRNGIRDDEHSWYWDPPKPDPQDFESRYSMHITELENQITALKASHKPLGNTEEPNIFEIQKENESLRASLDDLDSQHQMAMQKLLSMKQNLQKNFEVLKKEHDDLKHSNESSSQHIKELYNQLEQKKKELEQLKNSTDYPTLQQKYQHLEKIYSVLRENAEKFQEENLNLHEEVFKLQEKVTKLEHDMEVKSVKTERSNKVTSELNKEMQLMANNFTVESKKEESITTEGLTEINIDDNAKGVIELLKNEINDLKYKLNEGEVKHIKPENIMQLYNKYVHFDLPLNYVSESNENKDNFILFKIESAFKTLQGFEQELVALRHSMSEKDLNILHYKTHIEELSSENDFLTTDLQQYEIDLKEMRKNNDFLISEIAALKNSSKLHTIVETNHEDNLEKLETELADCNRTKTTFETQLKNMEKELQDVRHEKTILQSSLKDLKDKYESMMSELDNLKACSEKVEVLEKDHMTKLHNSEKDIMELKTKLLAANSTIQKLELDLSINENEKVLLTKKIDDLIHSQKDNETICKQKHSEEVADLSHKLEECYKQKEALNKRIIDLIHTEENLRNKNEVLEENNALRNVSIPNCNNWKSLNEELIANKIELESKLKQAENKAAVLEQDLDKLSADFFEKVAFADDANILVTQTNIKLQDLQRAVSELEHNNSQKKDEIENLLRLLEAANLELNNMDRDKMLINQELETLKGENDDLHKKIASLNHAEANFDKLRERLNKSEKICDEYKITIEMKEKEIKDLKTSQDNLYQQIKQINQQVEDSELLKSRYDELLLKMGETEKNNMDLRGKNAQLEKTCLDNKATLEEAAAEKLSLINLINIKHGESLNYHNEIQRLNQVIMEHSIEVGKMLEDKNKLIESVKEFEMKLSALNASTTSACVQCELYKNTLDKNASDHQKIQIELNNTNAQIQNTSQKYNALLDHATKLEEQVKKLTAENIQLSERETNTTKELERLRQHLVETEETYTQELIASEHKLSESLVRLQQIEERAKQNSTVYTSNSIRANQEVETLRNQIRLMERQRDDVQARLSEAEDAKSRSEAALTNLQVVLEQFQIDKERDVNSATVKLRKKLEDMKQSNNTYQNEVTKLTSKLEEALAGLQAASRLGDQVETKSAQISDLKGQVKALQASVAAAEERYHNATSNQQDRVDKNLVKNLFINYVVTPTNSQTNKTQVLRVLSTVLDFNQKECERLGLARTGTPDSLAAEFVRFLQNESTPRTSADTPGRAVTPSSRKTSVTSSMISSESHIHPVYEHKHSRTASSSSNNLLFQNMDKGETLSHVSVESTDHHNVLPLHTGVTQPRNTESAILKHVLKDI